uniref:Uncharacterized protein n=2 Tax=Corethron hystrix TaxID=216773 RepID=A0A7S1B641_9STRA|mmetsp:Transcript_14508/g.31899  ORF Transcript_14508/g.31899 Transcript_14508/m.31899 type:complete len:227 (+) Transcript_14508:588-1268(+)
MGKFENLRDMLDEAGEKGTKILSFLSMQSLPRFNMMVPIDSDEKDSICNNSKELPCLGPPKNATLLQTFNCNRLKEMPSWASRAKKQIYQPDYVLSHFVHYSTVTLGTIHRKSNNDKAREKRASAKKRERAVDQHTEAVMLHAKTVLPRETLEQYDLCITKWSACNLGFPHPNNVAIEGDRMDPTDRKRMSDPQGRGYNCFVNDSIENVWVPKLASALEKLENLWK